MKIPEIKKLVEQYSPEELSLAEDAILNERALPIEVSGTDEGEQLTHILAARWIKEQMLTGMEFNAALRAYTGKVRDSIS